jgi:hypothetical protein
VEQGGGFGAALGNVAGEDLVEREGDQPGVDGEIGVDGAVFAEALAAQIAREEDAGGGGEKDAAAFAAELRESVLGDFEADVGACGYGGDLGGVVGALVGSCGASVAGSGGRLANFSFFSTGC